MKLNRAVAQQIVYVHDFLSFLPSKAQNSKITPCIIGTHVLTVAWEVHTIHLKNFDHGLASSNLTHRSPSSWPIQYVEGANNGKDNPKLQLSRLKSPI